MLLLIAPILLSTAAGTLALRLLVRPVGTSLRVLFYFGFGFPLGSALLSLTFFLISLFLSPTLSALQLSAGTLFSGLLVLTGIQRRFGPAPVLLSAPGVRNGHALTWLIALTGVAVMAAGLYAVAVFYGSPHGVWDAQFIWNARARTMFRAPSAWRDILQAAHPHPDYPLAVTHLVLMGWLFVGYETQLASLAIALAFTLSGVAVVGCLIAVLKGSELACLGMAVLLSSSGFVGLGLWQYADVPLSAALTATVACLVLALRQQPSAASWLFLTGMFCSVCGWIKNEGWLLVVGVLSAVLMTRPFWREGQRTLRDLLFCGAGLVPPALVVVFFKRHVPANDIISAAAGAGTVAKLVDHERWLKIIGYYGQQLWHSPHTVVPLLAMPILLGLVTRLWIAERDRRSLLAGSIVCLAVIGGHWASFAVSPNDLDWHLRTAASRLTTQVTPALLALLFCCLDPAVFGAGDGQIGEITTVGTSADR